MSSLERRAAIRKVLGTTPIKGADLAKQFGVTRQIIVKDISLLKAEGMKIISTSEGYILNSNNGVRRVVAVSHKKSEISDELNIIIKYGGIVEDVTIEHPLYGEITGKIMIKTLYDIESFIEKSRELGLTILSQMTEGIHFHTIRTEDEESMEKIIEELNKSGYLLVYEEEKDEK